MKKKVLLLLLPLTMFACSDDSFNDAPEQPADNPVEESTGLTTVNLATFAGDPSRVTYPLATRAEEGGKETAQLGTLELVASVANPSKAEGFNFTKEEDGRWLSATSVYYDENDRTYYATYHMQGNNYNTELNVDTSGAIQTFTVNDAGVVTLGDGFHASDPSKEDFDFNHIYFDNTDRRIIAVGHNVINGNRKNTNAVIGVFDPEEGTYKYNTVKTAEKDYDENNKSIGYMDAGDVNCVVRTNDLPSYPTGMYYGWDIYLVATRKGMAVLHADEANLFKPYLTEEGTNYFIKTPGSAKYVAPTNVSSHYGLLYLADEHTGDVEKTTRSKAKIAKLKINTSPLWIKGSWSGNALDLDLQNIEGMDPEGYIELPEDIVPIDGKNTLCVLGDAELYAALGTSGVYYSNMDAGIDVLSFGNRPVNCVAVDNRPGESGHSQKGYLYVANGSKLTILKRDTLEEIVSWNMPSKDENGNDIESSANYITVRKVDPNDEESSVRIVTVAFGQAGVKVFKFVPPTKNKS